MKHYIPMNWEGDRVRWAKLISAKVLNDGSILASGETFDNDLQVLRPWILHVDADGCLVPGCNLVSTKNAAPNALLESDFKIFPNPVSHELYLFCQSTSQPHVELHVINQQGTILNRTSLTVGTNSQYILPIDHLLPGIYHIVITGATEEVESHTFVKN